MLSGRVLLVSPESPTGRNPIWITNPGSRIQDPGLVPFDGREARMMGSTPGWYGAHTDDQASRYLKPGLPESHHGSDVEFDLLKTCQN